MLGLQVTSRMEVLPTESQERERESRQVKNFGLDPFSSARLLVSKDWWERGCDFYFHAKEDWLEERERVSLAELE